MAGCAMRDLGLRGGFKKGAIANRLIRSSGKIRTLVLAIGVLPVTHLAAADQTVTDPGDNGGANQLRAKLVAVQSSGGGTVTFNIGNAIIILTQGMLPAITTNTTINGGGVVAISGANATPILTINNGGTLTLKNITITHGFASEDGGAVRNFGTLNANNCKFTENQTEAPYSGGAILSLGLLNLTNCEFARNKAGNGGAIYPRFPAAVTKIAGCNFHENVAISPTDGWGGAILLWDGTQVTITGSIFSANSARSDGGAIYVHGESSLTINTTQLSANAATNGGAIQKRGGSPATLTNVTMSGNTGVTGGALALQGAGTSNFLQNVTFSGNQAAVGGALYLNNASASVTNATLCQNTGRAIYQRNISAVSVRNTIITDNIGANCDTPVASSVFSLSDDKSCELGTGQDSAANISLGPLANNGGPTQTHLPQPGSAAINGGTATGAPARDQRNYDRAGAAPDVGAAEFGGTISVTLANIATRLFVNTGDNVLIGGFIITGTQSKTTMLRAIGPSLPLAGKLSDPVLELYQGNTLLESNNNWMESPNQQAILDTTIAPSHPLESAILRSLAPGAYTAVLRGANNGTGIGVVEAYDLDRTTGSKLANISTRGAVQTGDNVLIAGFIVLGSDAQTVIVRALGPSVPVPGALGDPNLELYNANGTILEANDNWGDSANQQAITDSIPPTNNLEAAILRILLPGNYTAIVRGTNNTTGVAVVEVYALD